LLSPATPGAPADYQRGSELFKRTCLLIDRILADIRVAEEMWRLGRGAGFLNHSSCGDVF